MGSLKTNNNLFCYRPDQSTFTVFVSVLLMWLLYFAGSKFSGLAGDLIFIIGVMICLSTVLPVVYVKKFEHGKLSDLGIHKNSLGLVLGVSIFFGLGSIFYYFQLGSAQNITTSESIRQLLWAMLALWEVLFVFGWVFIRFYRAFGPLLAILFTACTFTVYHIGSLPIEQLAGLFITGLVASIIFYFVKMNIFVLWPFAWGVAVAISSLQSGQTIASWGDVLLLFTALAIQVAIIWVAFNKPNLGKEPTK